MNDKTWDKKLKYIRGKYPDVNSIDWASIIAGEPGILRAIAGNVAGSNYNKKHGISDATQLLGTEFSELNFVDALNILWGDRSISDMVAKTNISHNKIYNMKRGLREPTFKDMEAIAKAFGKDPAFFLEYRIAKILASIDRYLTSSPETATHWFSLLSSKKWIKVK
ncbi:XRE family transcriptional regulator [Candidatus Saccharibacteria bacterium]|nr:MAG: XRE family transcriptional regulator [Candidatus Saccharibacteria bacterium]